MRKIIIATFAAMLLSGCTTVTYNCNVAGSCISEEAKTQVRA